MSQRIFIGLGSNLADPLKQLMSAVSAIRRLPEIEFRQVSGVYLTHPMGREDQADYYNAVAEVATELTASELLDALQAIEHRQGRTRDGKRWSERSLDLDILLYGNETIKTDRLVIPHPGMHERAFVLFPLHELDDSIEIPGRGNINQYMQSNLAGEVLQRLDVNL